MALSDLTRRVITRFEAVTDGLEAGAAKAKEVVTDVSTSAMSMGESFVEGVTSGVDALGKLNQAMEGINKIVDFAKESFNAYADDLRLQAAAGAADIEKLSEAASGLRNEHELLSFAAQTQHGIFKLNQEQMDTVQEAMVRLTRAGFDNQDVTDKLTDAVISLKTKGLDKLGIAVKDGTTDAEKFNNIMAALAQKANASDTATANAGESIQRMGVKWHDAMETTKKAIGELVVALGPLLEIMATAIGYAAKAVKWGAHQATFLSGGLDETDAANMDVGNSQKLADARMRGDFYLKNFNTAGAGYAPDTNDPFSDYGMMQAAQERANTGGAADVLSGAIGGLNRLLTADPWSQAADAIGDRLKAAKVKYDAAVERAKELAAARKKLANEVAKATTDDLVKQLEDEVNPNSVVNKLGGQSAVINQGAGVPSDITSAMLLAAKVQNQAAGYAAFNAKKNQSFLQGMFGKLEEFNAYHEAFSMISGAATTAFDALVDGTMSTGDAVKHFIADQLKALGGRMLVRGLEEVAEGIASLALGPLGGTSAAGHFAAAAAFGVGAAAAGVAASAIGTSASSSNSAGSASSSSSSGSGGSTSSAAPQGPIVVYGDSFSNDSPRQRQLQARRMVQKALGTSYASNS